MVSEFLIKHLLHLVAVALVCRFADLVIEIDPDANNLVFVKNLKDNARNLCSITNSWLFGHLIARRSWEIVEHLEGRTPCN